MLPTERIGATRTVPQLQPLVILRGDLAAKPKCDQGVHYFCYRVRANFSAGGDDEMRRHDEASMLLQGLNEKQFLGRIYALRKAADRSKDIASTKQEATAD